MSNIKNQVFRVNHFITQTLNCIQDFEVMVTGENPYPVYCRLNVAIQEILTQMGAELKFDESTSPMSVHFSSAEEKCTANISEFKQLGYQVSELSREFAGYNGGFALQILQTASVVIVRVYGVHNTPYYFSQGATAIGRFLGQGFIPVPIEPLLPSEV